MAIVDLTKISKHLFLCNGTSCKLLGAEESTDAIRSAIIECGLTEQIHTTKTLCNGRCKDGPIVISMPEGIWFRRMDKEKGECFVKKFLASNKTPWHEVLFLYGDDDIHTDQEVSRKTAINDDGYSSYF